MALVLEEKKKEKSPKCFSEVKSKKNVHMYKNKKKLKEKNWQKN